MKRARACAGLVAGMLCSAGAEARAQAVEDVMPQAFTIVQARRTVLTTKMDVTSRIPIDDTVPQFNEGTEVMTVQITPTSASNILMIEAEVYVSEVGNQVDNAVAALFRDIDTSAMAAGVAELFNSEPGALTTVRLKHFVPAGSTNPTTFRLRVGGDFVGSNILRINARGLDNMGLGSVLRSYMEVVELAVQ